MTAPVNSSFALDPNALSALQAKAKSAPDQKSLKQAATQFESVFMNMMLKSMRETLPQDSPFDNDSTRTYTSMLDQQLSQSLAGQGGPNGSGIGLADMIVKQLSRQMKNDSAAAAALPGAVPAARPGTSAKRAELQQIQSGVKTATSTDGASQAQSFISQMLPYAQAAQDSTGVPARFLLAQAALETGWGRSSVKTADGTDSHNIFGIKAGKDWKGPVVQASTTEYVNGVAQKVTQRFRAYASYADSFSDYAKLISGSARYKNVLAQGTSATGFASALQQAGYATDPQYAQKITRIIQGSSLKGVA